MPVPRRRLVALLAAGLLAAPASALGQSAGDDQYVDPFAGEGEQQEQSGSDDGVVEDVGGGQEPAAPAPETVAPAPAAAPTETAPGTAAPVTQSAPELPRTGAETGTILLAGSILLAGGIALRVRLREHH
jgi:LPXTG-motif cell wall-anchored protein